MKKDSCKKCKRNYNSLADGTCYFCDPVHWVAWWNKQYFPKK